MSRFAVVFVAIGCATSRKIPTDFDYGSWTGSTYKNDFFGFSITAPNGWHIASREEQGTLIDETKNSDILTEEAGCRVGLLGTNPNLIDE